jgi:hypothetical protein
MSNSNRDALRRLSRKFPAPPEIEQIMTDLRGQNDLSVAIVASAIVEAALEKLITTKLKTKNANLLGRLFSARGPLADFEAKILIAQEFGILTSLLASELHCVRAIRNTFAHAKVPITFDHELLDREMKALSTPKILGSLSVKIDDQNAVSLQQLSNKHWFLLLIKIILTTMHFLARAEE